MVDMYTSGVSRLARLIVVFAFAALLAPVHPVGEKAAAQATPCELLHHWTLDETAGTTAADLVQGGDDGTVTGASWTTAGKAAGALAFDGTGDYIDLGLDPLAPSGCGWSAALWVKRTADRTSNQSTMLFSPAVRAGASGVRLQQWGRSNNQVGFSKFGVADWHFSYSTPKDTWAHLVLVGTSSNTKLYADGTLVGTVNQSIDLPLHRIGAFDGSSIENEGEGIPAVLDDIRVYSKALTAQEVTALYGQLTQVNAAPVFDDGTTAVRSVVEDAAVGAAVGAALAVTDPDAADTFSFELSGGDGNFVVVNESGAAQIKVASGASLDHEIADSYSVTVTVSDGKDGSGGIDTSVDASITVAVTVTDVNEAGSVTFGSALPRAGDALTAMLEDPDAPVGSVVWTWTRLDASDSVSGTAISTGVSSSGASSSYSPTAGDVGKWLRAAAVYSDGFGAGRAVSAVSASAVLAAGTASFDDGATASRSVAEDAVVGSAVGAALAVTAPQGAAPVFELSGDDGNFTVVNESGAAQIKVASGVSLDHETTGEYSLTVTVADGVDGDDQTELTPMVDDSITVTVTVRDVDEAGSVSLGSSFPRLGEALVAVLDDPDGGVSGLSWVWEHLDDAMDASPTRLSGAASSGLSSSYTPAQADLGKLLRVRVSYTDSFAASKTASALSPAVGPNPQPEVIPRLRQWTGDSGTTVLSSTSRIMVSTADAAKHRNAASVTATLSSTRTLSQVAATIKADLKEVSGLDLEVVDGSVPRAGDVFLDLADAVDAGLDYEGYTLDVADTVTIRANTSAGVFYGSRSLLQILAQADDNVSLPRGTARDWPSQQARMIMLDIGRKYYEMDYLLDSFRLMSWYKMNVFNMHFSESEGFRLNDPVKFPGFADSDASYTKADIDRLEALADEYFVDIMPGFNFPGHATVISDHFGIGFGDGASPCGRSHMHGHLTPDFVIDMTSAVAVAKVKEIITHFTPWFGSPIVHLGADEVPGQLGGCPRVRNYISDTNGISNIGDVTVAFINDMNATVKSLGKRMMIYDGFENMNPSSQTLDGDIIVNLWDTSRATLNRQAARSGRTSFDILNMKLNEGFYLTPNYYYHLYPDQARIYDRWSPTTSDLGTGIAVWGDYVFWAEDEYIEHLLRRPRAVLADRTWNGTTTPDVVGDFHARMEVVGNPPGYEGFGARVRVDDGEPSHHYPFEAAPYPPSHFYASAPPNTILAQDVVGGLHGTSYIVQSPHVDTSDGVLNSSFVFDNDLDGIGIGGVGVEVPWSVSVWVKRTADRGTATLMSGRDHLGRYRYIYLDQGTSSRVGFRTPTGATHSFSYTVPLNTWTHLAFVATGGDTKSTKLYVNGRLTDTVADSMPLPFDAIAARRANGLRAKLDDLKIFDEALTAVQVAAEYGSYTAGFIVSTLSVEANVADTVTYTLKLSSQPSDSVVVTPQSANSATATVATDNADDRLTFTSANWNAVQGVTVTGMKPGSTSVTHTSVSTSDRNYAISTAASPVTVGVRGVVFSDTTVTAVGTGTVTYTVKLATAPTDTVTVTPTSQALGTATVLPASLSFTATNWSTTQTLTVTGVATGTTSITHAATSSSDANYQIAAVGSVGVTVQEAVPTMLTLTTKASGGGGGL